MIVLLRVVFAALLLAIGSAHAVVPSTTGYVSSVWPDVSGATLTAFCSAAAAKVSSLQTTPTCGYGTQFCSYSAVVQGTACYIKTAQTGAMDLVPYSQKAICPENSELVGGSCVCKAGFTEKNGACVPPTQCEGGRERDASGQCTCKKGTKEPAGGVGACIPDSVCSELSGKPLGLPVTVDYGSKSPGSLGRMIGQSSTTCFTGGCAVSGTVDGCWSAQGVAGCNITGATFTGEKCDDTKKPGDCPAGSTPSQYAAGVCIPDENKCPSGSSPSKYASGVCIPDDNPCPAGQAPSKYAAGVCVPVDDPNADGNGESGNQSKCPPGRVESRYAAGVCIPADTTVGDGNGGGGGTTCKDGKCTTTNPDGTTEEKPEQEYCKEHPDAPQCKKSTWGGSCGSFTCDGDAVMCAVAKEQHQRNCKLFDEKTSHPAYQAAVDGTDDQSAEKLKGKAEQISVGTNFNQAGFGWGSACPADPEIPLGFVDRSFTIPFSRICGPLEALSLAGVGITLLGCLVWVIGGKKA